VDFAAWSLLPIAMSEGCNLHIAGTGDPVTACNAKELSRIWELWMPQRFRSVEVSFDEYAPGASGSGRLVLYSGGVDSTYNLLSYEKRGERPTLLTVHGLDYRHEDDERFARLVEHTRPFVEQVSRGHILLKSDLRQAYRAHGIKAKYGHGFALAGALFLFEHEFGAGEIAPDFTLAEEYVAYPWGTNSVTNPLFASSSFRMETADNALSRTGKVQVLANSEVAVRSLSFCKDYDTRPLNCGICSKCTRTKAMFLATCSEVPPIFLVQDLKPLDQVFDLEKRNERAFFVDLYQTARANGHLERLRGIDALAKSIFSSPDAKTHHKRTARTRLTDWAVSRWR